MSDWGYVRAPANGHPCLTPEPRLYSYQNCSEPELYVNVLQGTSLGGTQALSLPCTHKGEKGVHFLRVHNLFLHPVPAREKRGTSPVGYTSSLSTLHPQRRKAPFLNFLLLFCFSCAHKRAVWIW